MLTKREVLLAIKQMPDTFSTTELFGQIILLKEIEEGSSQVKSGKTFTTEQARKKLKKWLR